MQDRSPRPRSSRLRGQTTLARECWERCRAAIESGAYDVVIMDELTYCFQFGWLDLAEVLEVLRRRSPAQHVVNHAAMDREHAVRKVVGSEPGGVEDLERQTARRHVPYSPAGRKSRGGTV